MTTTFADPFGIAASGKIGIVQLAPTSSSTPTVPRDAAWMIAVMSPTSPGLEADLPTSSQIGDMVEVYVLNTSGGGSFTMRPQSGETINGDAGAQVAINAGRLFRKVSSTMWVTLGS